MSGLKRPVYVTTARERAAKGIKAAADEEDEKLQSAIHKICNSELKAKFIIPASCAPGNKTITERGASLVTVTAGLDENIRVYAKCEDGTVISIRIVNALRETATHWIAYEVYRRAATVTIVSDKIVNHPSLEFRNYGAFLMEKDDESTDFRVASLFEDKRYVTFKLVDGLQVVYLSLPAL